MAIGPDGPTDVKPACVCPCRGEILAALAAVLDYTTHEEMPHHARTAVLAARLAAHVGGADAQTVFYAALAHDIGMLAAGFQPPHTWNLEEQANHPAVRYHPVVGAQVIGTAPGLLGAAQIILDHHEWANGHGYPRGKAAGEIAPGAQMLRFADTCDMLLREQPWPERIEFLHAARSRTEAQVERPLVDAGIEVLGEAGFYAQLRSAEDVFLLVESGIRRLAARDLVTTDAELTALLELFGHLTDAHPADKLGHSRRVASLAVLVGLAMGLDKVETAKVKWAALVHDVGLVAVPKALLDKPGLLTEEELARVRRHVAHAEQFLRRIHGLEEVVRIAASFGEAFDGSGYPQGLAGEAIPIGSRILTVCDTFDALTSRRPYREARDTGLAIDILLKGSGTLFDPAVVDAAVPVFLAARSAEEPAAAGEQRRA